MNLYFDEGSESLACISYLSQILGLESITLLKGRGRPTLHDESSDAWITGFNDIVKYLSNTGFVVSCTDDDKAIARHMTYLVESLDDKANAFQVEQVQNLLERHYSTHFLGGKWSAPEHRLLASLARSKLQHECITKYRDLYDRPYDAKTNYARYFQHDVEIPTINIEKAGFVSAGVITLLGFAIYNGILVFG